MDHFDAMRIEQATPADTDAIERLLDAGFGPARRRRTAYRLRDGAVPIADLSFVARAAASVVGSVQCWPSLLRADSGRTHPLTLLGPVVVDVDRRGAGIASALVAACLAAADVRPILLIGDAPFYGRWGFSADHTAGWRVPGPVDPARLLARHADALPEHGVLAAAGLPAVAAA